MAKPEQQRIAEIIERHVAYFNGWAVNEKTMKENCSDAASDILFYLKRRDSQLTSSPERWQCLKCANVNHIMNGTCENCGTPAPAEERKLP